MAKNRNAKKWYFHPIAISIGSLLLIAVVVGIWKMIVSPHRPLEQPVKSETIKKSVQGILGVEDESEVFVPIISEQDFVPGTIFHKNRRLVIARPALEDSILEPAKPRQMTIRIHEKRKVIIDGQIESKLFDLSGKMHKDGDIFMNCDDLSVLETTHEKLQNWLEKSREIITTAMQNKNWTDEPPLMVYRAVKSDFKITVDLYFSDLTRVVAKEIPGMKGGFKSRDEAGNHYEYVCKEPAVIGYCALRLKPELRMGPQGAVKPGEYAKTDSTSAWEEAPLVKDR